ncbi:protein translocase subunit SecD [Aeromicrobium sp. 636]|uniref:Multifunctional fusion protein n=1 Tax=Aeromicrobium senzhongii TaxID=2663859 RepID=A0A8I0K031_9ACTN|nr:MULTISPECIES: protein translocase subunit SecD [Aeromicrobium]MBC9225353.1 protein translocase subunit SecD [Aeromicrobium senzhongii]MCQ3997463.1 protein translocase subunit SecD [Aeromicrobium sp. 636]MTB87391.1 protein translocase subunit SecD [Aeromicrobium senzhongii]QNL95551.1 protein translocase subunit SecD [Aeromicrobium senzhongii]
MSSKTNLWRGLICLAVIIGAAAVALTMKPNLGLDLRGGTQITLEAKSTDRVKADAEATDRALEVLRGRVDGLGVSEPTLARTGENRIIIELPNVQDPSKAAEVIGQTASLEFREVMAPATAETKPGKGEVVLPDEQGQELLLGPVAFDGNGISDAEAAMPQNSIGDWVVNVQFNKTGRTPWSNLVASACQNPAAGNRIAIVLDNEVISSPGIVPELCAGGGGSSTSITGDFTQTEAQDLAVLIKGGALPVPVEIIDQRTVGPTLGAAAIDASINASIIGLLLTGLFIIFIYRLTGVMATIALTVYALISYGALVLMGATLTLPGLAGFVLAIGLAIDANVLVYERAREEYHENPKAGLLSALTTGFSKAWSAIIDSNVTTILAALLLFFLSAGPVKGFGITLTIGVIASMFSALVVARWLTEWLVKRKWIRNHPQASGIGGISSVRRWLNEHGPYLVRRAGMWVVISLGVAGVMIAGILVRGLDLGVEFAGGRQLEYSTAKAVTPDQAREAVTEAGFPEAVVQSSSADGGENISVRLPKIDETEAEKVRSSIEQVGGKTVQVASNTIDPTLGKELRNKALLAFLIAVAAQMAYLAWRFRWTWAAAAIVSMASVVLAVVGVFAWWGKPIDGVFLAAILSIIGLAVNDSIVVLDRIRERTRTADIPLREMVNEAILSTLPRTINTAMGATFILAALMVLGGDSLRDFSIAVLLGLLFGHFSTVFTASTLGLLLEEKWPYNPDKDPRKTVDPYAHVVDGRGMPEDGGAVV